MIKGILFDKDGTLFDYNATWGAWTMGMLESEAQGDTVKLHALADVLGYDLENKLFYPESIVIASTVEELADAVLSVVPGERSAVIERMNAAACDAPQVEPVPLQPLLILLKESGIKLGVATNDSEVPARAHLQRAGVEGFFDFIAGYDSGFGGKPASGQMLGFLEATGLNADQCLMVGDSLHDIHAGHAAGMRTVGVLTGPASRSDLSPFADVVLNTIGELPAWITAGA